MRSLREIEKSISRAPVESKPEADRAVLQHLLAELATVARNAPAPTKLDVSNRIRKAMTTAATVILSLRMTARPRQRTPQPLPEDRTQSAADLLTVGCLNAVWRRGGLEAVDRQCEAAAQRLANRPQRISVHQLIAELKAT